MLPFIFCVRLIDPVGFSMPPLLACAAKCNVHKHSRCGTQHAGFTSELNHTPQFWFYKEQRAVPNPTKATDAKQLLLICNSHVVTCD